MTDVVPTAVLSHFRWGLQMAEASKSVGKPIQNRGGLGFESDSRLQHGTHSSESFKVLVREDLLSSPESKESGV